MYPTHAAVLNVVPRDDMSDSLESFVSAVRNVVGSWMTSEVGAKPDLLDSSVVPGMSKVPISSAGSDFGEIVEAGLPDVSKWAWQGWIERLMPTDAACDLPRTLRSDVQMRAEPSANDGAREVLGDVRVVVTLREQLAFPTGHRPPNRQSAMAPPCGLLGALFESFRIFQGEIEWTRTYQEVRRRSQIELLYRLIVSPTRTVPLVVCVGDEHQGPPIDPIELGRHLFGVGRVFHIINPRFTGTLRDLIGEKHRVGWNVIRLYRPRFSRGDSSAIHPFFKKDDIDRYGSAAFPDVLSGIIRREESFLAAPDAIVRDRIHRAEDRQSRLAIDAVMQSITGLRPLVGEVGLDTLQDAIAIVVDELEAAKVARDAAVAESAALHHELDERRNEEFRLRRRLVSLEAQLRGSTQPMILDDDILAIPKTVREAVDQVRATVLDGELVFHPKVIDQVKKYRGGYDPIRVRDSLLIILDVARRCRESQGDGMTPEDYFREHGVVLKNGISETAEHQFRDEYAIEIDCDGVTEKVLLGPHVDLSKSQRIYWYHDKEASRFVIGHIGPHLRDASTR